MLVATGKLKTYSPQYKSNKHLCELGENYVVNFLKKDGFSLIAKNFNTKLGEVDAILKKADLFIFVEVKTRNGNSFLLDNIVGRTKQKRIISAAKNFLLQKQISLSNFDIRFDVAIVGLEKNEMSLQYIPAAFYA